MRVCYIKMNMAAGIKVATTSTVNVHTAADVDEDDQSNKTTTTVAIENESALFAESSFRSLPSLKERQSTSLSNESQHNNKVPLENSEQNVRQMPEKDVENLQTPVANRDLGDIPKSHFKEGEDVDHTSTTQFSPGLSLLQQTAAASSPPPHSYRHSRAYRHFKNPPQPHMCIRTTTEAGEELFINVLSWTRIVIPQEPSDPIPLYGGMRVSCTLFLFFFCKKLRLLYFVSVNTLSLICY